MLFGEFQLRCPGLVLADINDKFFLVVEYRCAATATRCVYLDEIERKPECVREARRLLDIQHLVLDVEFHDRGAHVARDLLRGPANSLQDPLERRVGGDHFEDLVLREREFLVALALGNVGDADANQLAIAGGQAAESHLARNLLAGRILVQPLEHRVLAGQCARDMTTAHAERWRAVRLPRRADLRGTYTQ